MLRFSKRAGAEPRSGSGRFTKFLVAGLGVAMLGTGIGGAVASVTVPRTGTAAVAASGAGEGAATAEPRAATQAVGITYEGGPGHPRPVWAGTWDNPTRGFCIDFSEHSPTNAGTTRITGPIPGMSARQSALIKFITNAYAQTKSPKEAARAQFAIWKVEGDPAFATWYGGAALKPADRRAVDAIIARAEHDPYRIGVRAAKLQVGQVGKGTVKVLGGTPEAAAGIPVELSATGARIRSVNGVAGTTGTVTERGVAFTYERSGTGRVDIRAVLAVPSASTAGLSITESDHQRTLSGGYVTPADALFSYQVTPRQPTVTSSCATDCNGVATLTFKACNPADADPLKWTQKVGAQTVASFVVAAGKCASKTAKVADGRKVVASYCYTGTSGACTTDTVTAPKSYEVVCPAWAKAVYAMSCNCAADGAGTVTFTAPDGSGRFYRGFVTVTAAKKVTTRHVDLTGTAPAEIDVGPVADGGDVVVSFRAYKDSKRSVPIGGPHVLAKVSVAAGD